MGEIELQEGEEEENICVELIPATTLERIHQTRRREMQEPVRIDDNKNIGGLSEERQEIVKI